MGKSTEEQKAQARAYYAANKERIKSRIREWQKKNPDKVRAYARTTYHRNPQLEKSRVRQREARQKYRLEAMEILGGAFCKRCGFEDRRALQIDHVNGGGRKEIEELGGGNALVHRVRKNPEGYQVLCANCNWIKRFENGEGVGGYTS